MREVRAVRPHPAADPDRSSPTCRFRSTRSRRSRAPTSQYIQQLADEVGYVFYIEPGPAPGTNIAYFGPEIKIGVPQPALNLDMDAHTNVESLSFSFDPTKGVLPVVFIQNQLTRVPIPIPIPNLNPLQPPLGVLPTPIANIKVLKDTAKLNPMQAISRGLAEAEALAGRGERERQPRRAALRPAC